ncbi:MAG: hypothetical protein KDJ15_04920 [Alphaproteobacteria bacterium]|nr:hypothetical protein [Alphaproteobacteria bacterium]
MADYISLNAEYPRPASRIAADGISVAALNMPAAGCTNGVCTANDGNGNVFIGAVPYASLGIEADVAWDNQWNQFTYAVSAQQTDQATYDPNFPGAVNLFTSEYNAAGALVTNQSWVTLVLVSHGDDGKGGFQRNGGAPIVACAASLGQDNENCDDDARFVDYPGGTAPGAQHFDDTLFSNILSMVYVWNNTRSLVPGQAALLNLGEDNMGVGIRNPEHKLHVSNADSDPSLPSNDFLVQDTDLADGIDAGFMTGEYCDLTETNCFSPDVLGGDMDDGEGLACPPGEVLGDVVNGSPVCVSTFLGTSTGGCAPGGRAFVTGINLSYENDSVGFDCVTHTP